MNLAEQEMRGWAWNCGAGVLPLLLVVLEDGSSQTTPGTPEIPKIVREVAKKHRNQRDRDLYVKIRGLLDDLALNARLLLKLPKTLPALRREPHPFRRVERDLYREFFRYGLGVAEVMPFAMKVGVMGVVRLEQDDVEYSKSERKQLLDAWEKAASGAEEDFTRYEGLFRGCLDGEISGSKLVNEAAKVFFEGIPESRGLWNRLVDAVMLSPNLGGVGVDLKKL